MANTLQFQQGTLVLQGPNQESDLSRFGLTWDQRTLEWRAPASKYRELVLTAMAEKFPLIDQAKDYNEVHFQLTKDFVPRPHQTKALDAWLSSKGLGVVCLPTGAGKSFLGLMAIIRTRRPSLVVVPTIDLMQQWQSLLTERLGVKIGMLGGGSRELEDVTVATYDSALLCIEQIGHRFGLVIFDEVHHLPAPQYQLIALGCLAPFRLGLSATLSRTDGGEAFIFDAVGPLVYEANIAEMVDNVLAPYDVVNCEVDLNDQEMKVYQENRELYLQFIRKHQIAVGSPRGWQEFLSKASYLPGGAKAMQAYRLQKRLSQAPIEKFSVLWNILCEHSQERCIVFTDDNKTAYRIGEMFLLPVLTHKTKAAERRQMLEHFRDGTFSVLVTSKVLNEGVDVPEASIAVVFSGSATVREHVQRLGRILRHQPGKRATLYELISGSTGEGSVQRRRRQHHAYEKFN